MSILLFYFLINAGLCAIIDDEITYLPGWGYDLPSKQYSGMIEIPDTNRHYHYWFIESFGDPMNDPFVVWLNGGPGASGLLGYFLENGPFKLNELSLIYNDTDVPQLFLHNYTYSNIANVLYIESPAGVGFSWCFGYLGPYESCPPYNDSIVASDNYQLLKIFFEGFSEYMDHEFYLSGESYAGVYVTTLVMEIENNNNAGLPELKGFILNNQCMGLDGFGGCDNDAIALTAEQLYGLGQMSHELYDLLWDVCGNSIIYGNYTNDKECLATLIYGLEYIGGFNVYDIYDTCVGIGQPNSVTKPHLDILNGYITMNSSVAYNGRQYFNKNDHPYIDFNKISSNSSTNPDSPYVCGGLNALNIYANNPTVKEYIHVPDIHWAMRDDTVLGTWPKYHKSQHNLVPYYKKCKYS